MAKQWHQLERLDHKALKKLQAEREKAAKLAAQAEERKKMMLIGGAISIVLLVIIIIVVMMNNRAKERAWQEERTKLLFSEVTEFSGTVEARQTGLWEPLTTNLKFKEDYSFRTEAESSMSVQMHYENSVKLYPESEMIVKVPVLEKKENKVKKEMVELTRGEVTAAISLDGRDILNIQVANVNVVGQSGLFKVIYNDETDKGEVIVKNGLVEVSIANSGEKPIKISGFYKVAFVDGELQSPTQASVIQYNWK